MSWYSDEKKTSFFFALHKTYISSNINVLSYLPLYGNFLFLCIDRGNIIAVYGRVRELSDSIKIILIFVPKMNEGLTSLEWHEGE